ncbi:hypothetical protein ACE1AT_18385 [Pelatocladus sp. BLCC-F211]|uniref:hypothetical protein n=1 Tax=Pelatocladus sp. BLCC-F211 TaxID=3342752 RepID=UPI0035B7932E
MKNPEVPSQQHIAYQSQPATITPVTSNWDNEVAVIQVQPTGVTFVIPYNDSNQYFQYGFIAIAATFAVAYLIRSVRLRH